MEKPHTLISGYRDLDQAEINLINEIKVKGEELGLLCEKLEGMREGVDLRWVAIGKTHLQQGIMDLVRAVARPESF